MEANIFIFLDIVYSHMAKYSGGIPHLVLCLCYFCIFVPDEPIFITFLCEFWSG